MNSMRNPILEFAGISRIDIVGEIIYIGKTDLGRSETDENWSIKKIDTANPIKIGWAEGKPDFSFRWTDRATYTYS